MAAAVSRIETAADVVAADACLTTAFASDPFTRWIFSSPRQFLDLFNLVLAHMGGLGAPHGRGFIAEAGKGAALWLPPGTEPDLEGLGPALADLAMPASAADVMGDMAAHHPKEPHWYLPFVGVDPAAQGQGIGQALLLASLSVIDAQAMPAYLESTNPRNVPLYEKFGFRVTALIQHGDSPPLYAMLRAAR